MRNNFGQLQTAIQILEEKIKFEHEKTSVNEIAAIIYTAEKVLLFENTDDIRSFEPCTRDNFCVIFD